MAERIAPGEVWLVGAGPGDPELLTRKAELLLGAASVVFYDALVGSGVLDFAASGARKVHVGKRSGRHSIDQIAIDRLIVDAALAGERVVRLKGGDPAIFGRATEELDACRAAGVPVRICPGVTAASAAAASLGLSLTLRGLARKLTFVTAHVRAGEELDLDWQALADPEATLAIYMGKAAANEVSNRLIAAGLAADTPVALVENASLPEERVFNTRLDFLGLASLTALSGGPALLLIGQALRVAGDGHSTSTEAESKTAHHASLPPAVPLERKRMLAASAMAPYPEDRGTMPASAKPEPLYIQSMPHIGISDTSSSDRCVTDCAAGRPRS